jgi:PAS domain S-box-containing protein
VDLAVIATDPDGVVTTWNARAESLYGWTRGEAVGRHISDLTVPEESRRAAEEIMTAIQNGDSWQGPFRLRRKDGSRFTAYVKDSAIHDEEERLIGIVGVSIEIGDPNLAQAVRSLIGDGNHSSGRRTRALSPREREVLALMAEGRSNAAIAAELVVTDGAVEKHVSNIFAKLGLPATASDHRRVLAVLTYLRG